MDARLLEAQKDSSYKSYVRSLSIFTESVIKQISKDLLGNVAADTLLSELKQSDSCMRKFWTLMEQKCPKLMKVVMRWVKVKSAMFGEPLHTEAAPIQVHAWQKMVSEMCLTPQIIFKKSFGSFAADKMANCIESAILDLFDLTSTGSIEMSEPLLAPIMPHHQVMHQPVDNSMSDVMESRVDDSEFVSMFDRPPQPPPESMFPEVHTMSDERSVVPVSSINPRMKQLNDGKTRLRWNSGKAQKSKPKKKKRGKRRDSSSDESSSSSDD
jgi:hypothetical protein